MPFFADISAEGWVLIIGAFFAGLASCIPKILQGMARLKKLEHAYSMVWHGIVARGYVEAARTGMMRTRNGKWRISIEARQVYAPRAPLLRSTFRAMTGYLGREPSDTEFAWELENNPEIQEWMIRHVCPELSMSEHGCLAVAYELAKEPEPDPDVKEAEA